MSVKVENRRTAKTQYVYDAVRLYDTTIHFLSRLSARYGRLLAPGIMELASDFCDLCNEANSVYPSDDERKKLREGYLLQARAKLDALDVKFTTVFRILLENPQGCYTKSDGETSTTPSEAKAKLERLCQTLGDLVSDEREALTKLLKTD